MNERYRKIPASGVTTMNDKDGGYCPKCDTVWAAPGKCNCQDHITYSSDEFPIPTFHCAKCGQNSKGFSLCLKCNPQTYTVVGLEKAENEMAEAVKNYHGIQIKNCPIEVAADIWNAAIEAAANSIVGAPL